MSSDGEEEKKAKAKRERRSERSENDRMSQKKKSEMTHFTAQTQKLNITVVHFGSSSIAGMKLRSKADGGENG